MAKSIMIQGTASNVGKSLICSGLCRIFKQGGYKVAPFKSQNMALNSYITADGLEIGRAQAVQAEAAGVAPTANMNPILLKPTSDAGSQVIVNGEVRGNMSAREYFRGKTALISDIKCAYFALSAEYEIIVIEGAGSPVELNLKKDDIVNMGMAKMAAAPVLLVGDIDKGGVFAQLYGTLALLEADERDMVKALIVNKFRGDITLFDDGRKILADKTNKPVAGVVPYIDVDIDDEDSLSERLTRRENGAVVDIAVIRLPRISNFTDFAPLEATSGAGVRYITKTSEMGEPDLVIIPGTKNTIADLRWLRETGLEAAIKKSAAKNTPIFGVCGGYQMLGERVTDAENAEGGGSIAGMGLLPVATDFTAEKRRARVKGRVLPFGVTVEGYEIHMGKTILNGAAKPFIRLEDGSLDGCIQNNIYGTYLHGFFDSDDCRNAVVKRLFERKGAPVNNAGFDLKAHRESQYDKLAAHLRACLDMELIYKILEAGI